MAMVPSLQQKCVLLLNSLNMSTAFLPYPIESPSMSKNLYIVARVNTLTNANRFKPLENVINIYDDFGVFQYTQSKNSYLKAIYTEEADDLCLEICISLLHVVDLNIVKELNQLGFRVDGSETISCNIVGFIETSDSLFVSWRCDDMSLEQVTRLPNTYDIKLEALSNLYDDTSVLDKFLNFHCYFNES